MLLRAAPPLTSASVFFLMVSAICHFPFHPKQGFHVPYRSMYCAHAAFTPTAAGVDSSLRPDWSRSPWSTPVLTVPYSHNDASSAGLLSLIFSIRTCHP